MKLSLVFIIYRSNSSAASEASTFCENVLKEKNIKSIKINSEFNTQELDKYLTNSKSLPDIFIVLGGDGTVLKCANALEKYDIPLLSFNIGGNLGFLTQEKNFLFDKSFVEILEKEEFIIDSRNRLKCEVFSTSEKNCAHNIIQTFDALNDFYSCGQTHSCRKIYNYDCSIYFYYNLCIYIFGLSKNCSQNCWLF